MDSLSFGRYVPYNTFVHRLDPRSKIMFLILLMVAIFMPFSVWTTSVIFSFIHLILVLVVMAISKDMNILNTISICILVNLTMTEINKLLIEIPSRKRYLRTEKIGLKCLKYDQKLNKKN
jgi:energy-coupling factor transport system permease protein